MLSNRLKNSISFLILALFLATKLIGLHMLTHDDSGNEDRCVVCYNIAAESHTPAVPDDPEKLLFTTIEIVSQNEVVTGYDFQVSTNTCPRFFFSRPPPSI